MQKDDVARIAAKLAVAREALGRIEAYTSSNQGADHVICHVCQDAAYYARRALKELDND